MANRHTKQTEINRSQKSINNLQISLGLIIAAFAFILYAQSISFTYTLDDSTVITDNKVVKKGIDGIPTILSTDRLYGNGDQASRTPEYRPVALILLAVEWELFPGNPNIAHLINVLLYAFMGWILFIVLCKLFENQNVLFPFICSLLYVAHPVHTEVVDSIKSIDEILCFLFGILSVWFILKYHEKQSKMDLIRGGICYFISLMSKESGITFLIIIPLLLYVFTTIDLKKIFKATLLLAGISGLFLLIRFKVLESFPDSLFSFQIAKTSFNAPDVLTQKATSFFILLKYILLLIFPYPLTHDYSFAQIPFQKFSDIPAIAGILIYLAMGIYALIFIRQKGIIALAILFYLITLFPVSNILLVIGIPMAERFLFIPSLGFCMAITYFLIKVTKTDVIKSKFSSIGTMISYNSILFKVVFILIGFYSIMTIARNPDWKDNIALFSHDVEVSDNCSRAHFAWGYTLLTAILPKEKNEERYNKLLDSTINEFTKAVSIYKIYPDAYSNLGICYYNKKDYQNAIKNYEIAKTQYHEPIMQLFNNLSHCYRSIGQYEKALTNVDSAIRIDTTFIDFYFNKAYILSKMGNYKDAIFTNQKVLEIDPKNTSAYKNLESLYLNIGDTLNSKAYFDKANRMSSRQQR